MLLSRGESEDIPSLILLSLLDKEAVLPPRAEAGRLSREIVGELLPDLAGPYRTRL